MSEIIKDRHVVDELTSICNSLGKLDERDGTYMKDRDCKACLKEIQRFLNVDGKDKLTRCTLGSYNIVKSDLLPLINQYCSYTDGDPELFNLILRLCTNITSPLQLLFNERENIEDKEEKEEFHKLQTKLLNCLIGYKEAFAEDDVFWSIINTHLRHNQDDEIVFERLIILIRNILHIPIDSTADMGSTVQIDSHELCLFRIDKSGLLDTLLEITSESQRGSQFCFHLIEIIYFMLRDQNPATLAHASHQKLKNKLDESDVDKKRLEELSIQNRKRKRDEQKLLHFRIRGSSFVVSNIRSISGNPLVLHKPSLVASREEINFDRYKTELRKAKNKKPLSSETSMVFSDTNTKKSKVSYSLKLFCRRFVDKVYNNYMQQIKYNLIQKKNNQENDETYYLWAIQFFSAFCRHSKMLLEYISETTSASTLHYIQVLIIGYQDIIKMEKKTFHDTSKRLHMAIRAYREILILIRKNENFAGIRKTICGELDYSTLLLNLLQEFDEPKHSKHYLADLIITNSVFLEVYQEVSSDTFVNFLHRYCAPNVIKSHLIALEEFQSNDDRLNLAILKLFQKISFDCDSSLALCQASVFNQLLKIIKIDSKMQNEFKLLAINLIKTFGRMANKKNWMFQELLFWKSGPDIIEIENAIDPPAAIIPQPEIVATPPPTGDANVEAVGAAAAENDEDGDIVDLPDDNIEDILNDMAPREDDEEAAAAAHEPSSLSSANQIKSRVIMDDDDDDGYNPDATTAGVVDGEGDGIENEDQDDLNEFLRKELEMSSSSGTDDDDSTSGVGEDEIVSNKRPVINDATSDEEEEDGNSQKQGEKEEVGETQEPHKGEGNDELSFLDGLIDSQNVNENSAQ